MSLLEKGKYHWRLDESSGFLGMSNIEKKICLYCIGNQSSSGIGIDRQ
jgi:hypothetical protein